MIFLFIYFGCAGAEVFVAAHRASQLTLSKGSSCCSACTVCRLLIAVLLPLPEHGHQVLGASVVMAPGPGCPRGILDSSWNRDGTHVYPELTMDHQEALGL